MSKLLAAFILFFIAQTGIWIQTNGQFIWPWFKKNPFAVSIIFGTAISYIIIFGTKLIVEYYDGLLWPGRFFAFGIGIISFAFLTWYFMGEGITVKTIVSLILACTLIAIQLFWK
tara:strand:- start:212 stop:556 length:345 start_codon:yes stop_codon:yes gene_type:complete